jgi:succinate dehydrogenase / fumarate reductase cytochrome b subunit
MTSAFLKRRLHSLTGLFLSLFLIEHLFVNSQSALFLGDFGETFIRSANGIHDLPYLKALELGLLLVPFVFHGYLGLIYLWEGAPNDHASDGSRPSLPQYSHNKGYTWQRITALILVFGVIGHVIHMRFLDFPEEIKKGAETSYKVEVPHDPLLLKLAKERKVPYEVQGDRLLLTTHDFGTAELFVVRKSFLSPTLIILYLLFLFSSIFHGFNGLWTFLISWGITLSKRSQVYAWRLSSCIMVVLALFGLMAIFGGF